MPSYIKDFVGLNILVNDPIAEDSGSYGVNTNTIGYKTEIQSAYSLTSSLSESKVLPFLNTHRNGPWGYSSWKQMRTSDNSISRYNRRNNIHSYVEHPKEKIIIENSKQRTVIEKNSQLRFVDEPPIVSKHYPLSLTLYQKISDSLSTPLRIKIDYNNEANCFSNLASNANAGREEKIPQSYHNYKNLYLGPTFRNDNSLIKGFESLLFTQCIYPPEKYTFKPYVRTRKNYQCQFWRTLRTNRTEQGPDGFSSTNRYRSKWPLDVSTDWTTRAGGTHGLINHLGVDQLSQTNNFGSLWNNYCFAYKQTIASADVNSRLRPGCYYSRRHTLTASGSVTNPSGRRDLAPASNIPIKEVFGGEAFWDASAQSGLEPFSDSIEDFYEKLKPVYKDYTVIPEFRMEDHIDFFLNSGSYEERANLFQLQGGKPESDDSNEQNFYKVYSTSDFLKNFEIIVDDHKDFVNPSTISLRCKAVKKFLPYSGFYPAERTTEIAQKFYESYKDNFTFSSGFSFLTSSTDKLYGAQSLIQPLFAPGVLFNTIKSGVACDFLSFTDSGSFQDSISNNLINFTSSSDFSESVERIPFEALLEPEEFLANKRLVLAEPHSSSVLSVDDSAIWDGHGKEQYKLIINNFLAEVPQFFLKNKNFTILTSQEQGNPNFGNLKAGTTYGMRIKMYRSMKTGRIASRFDYATGSVTFLTPQDIITGSNTPVESLTMYSRPSAFGPPAAGAAVKFGPYDSDAGYNFPYTPPYYHGVAFADIYFEPTQTKKYSIQEIFNSSSVEYYRVYHTGAGGNAGNNFDHSLINNYAMQLSASLNIFGLADPPDPEAPPDNYIMQENEDAGFLSKLFGNKSDYSIQTINVVENANARWAIQTKFECPILNFNHIQTSSMTMPQTGAASVPIGMWHQYGRLPQSDEGVYLQIQGIPKGWKAVVKGSGEKASARRKQARLIGNLNKELGFSTDPVRLGEIANYGCLEEAVVAIPFYEENNERKFFKIERDVIDKINKPGGIEENERTNLVGDSIVSMVQKMRKYNFPPTFDFLRNSDIAPFSMYIFEFKEFLRKNDLVNIWQNLPPTIGSKEELAESSITHELLSHHLMGNGRKDIGNQDNHRINDKVRWMVFKVKRKSKNNYNEKILLKKGTTGRQTRDLSVASMPIGKNQNINYNWPHDHYSLVELCKIDASVEFSKIEDKQFGKRGPKVITKEDL